MGKPGRPPHPATPIVEELVRQGFDDVAIVVVVRQLGGSIDRRTVSRIRSGQRRPSVSLLQPGERRLAQSEQCGGCGGRIDVVPCRTCAAVGPDRARTLNELGRRRDALDDLDDLVGP